MSAEDAEGSFDGSTGAREVRREAILRMNRDGMPLAIRQALDDPPLTDPEPLRAVSAPTLVIGQEGDPVHAAWVARELAETLPHAELLMFPDPFAMMQDIPRLVSRIAGFLAG